MSFNADGRLHPWPPSAAILATENSSDSPKPARFRGYLNGKAAFRRNE